MDPLVQLLIAPRDSRVAGAHDVIQSRVLSDLVQGEHRTTVVGLPPMSVSSRFQLVVSSALKNQI